jgi:hypothetical protein
MDDRQQRQNKNDQGGAEDRVLEAAGSAIIVAPRILFSVNKMNERNNQEKQQSDGQANGA